MSAEWYGQYADANGKIQRVPLSTDKTAAQQMLNALVKKAQLGKVGILDPFEDHRKRPLAEHLADFETSLRADGASSKHVSYTVRCIRRILEGCHFVLMSDLSASRTQEFLAELRERPPSLPTLDPGKGAYTKAELAKLLGVKPPAITPLVKRHRLPASGNGKSRRYPKATAEALVAMRSRGLSIKTANDHLGAAKHFCHWLVQDRRRADNPLEHLSGGNVRRDRCHDRRALTEGELRRLLDAAWASGWSLRGLVESDRYFLYLAAMGTGFRAGELAVLEPESFALDQEPPVVVLGATHTKNQKPVVQPLPPDVADALRGYLEGRRTGQPVWHGNWCDNAADMLREDLLAAGIPYTVEGPDGPLYADFHAL